MKTFTIKPTAISKGAGGGTKDYLDLAAECLEARVNASVGFTVSEISARLNVLRKVEAAPGSAALELEDAEAATLLSCINAMDGLWGLVSADIVAFVTDARSQLA